MKKIELLGLQTIPEIEQGDNLAEIIVKSAQEEAGGVREKDILVFTSKIVSKAAGRVRKLSDVIPGKKALAISRQTGKDAKWLQMIFDEGHEILAILPIKGIVEEHIMSAAEDKQCGRQLCEHEQAVCVTRGKNGMIHTCDAGIDGSNHQKDVVSLLPENPDHMAKDLRQQIKKLTGKQTAVLLADTEMIPFGTIDIAVGASGISVRSKMFGKEDLFGKPKFGGMDLVAYELTSASALAFGQVNAGIPVVIIRGYEYEIDQDDSILKSIWSQSGNGTIAGAIKETLRATSCAMSLKSKIILKVASWLI